MTDPIEAAAAITYSEHVNCAAPWADASEEERELCMESARRVIAAYRDAEIEALQRQLADCRADAERWRFSQKPEFFYSVGFDNNGRYYHAGLQTKKGRAYRSGYGKTIDEAIDKARQS